MDLTGVVVRLRAMGERITPQRIAILRTLVEAPHPLTAAEVLQVLHENGRRASLDTVYRNLALLASTGLVNQLHLQSRASSRYEFQGDNHHHHAVCLRCGKTFCVPHCPLPDHFPSPAEDPGFRTVSHALELYGHCSKCACGAR